jgi:ParB family chromosome partitioning protein
VAENGSSTTPSKPGKTRRTGLGRGLGSLIPTAPEQFEAGSASPEGPVHAVPIDQIVPNPYQPRTVIDRVKLEELAESIRTHGLVQPLVVATNPNGDGWTLIAGERRWRASRLAGLTTIPVVVREAAPQAMLELAIIENVVRADLGPLEEATAFRQLIDEFGLSQAEVANRVGRSRTAVANTLRLLGAPPQLQEALAALRVTEGHARAILGLTNTADQLAVLEQVIEQGLNVRQTESVVRRWQQPAAEKPAPSPRDADEIRIEDRLRTALGTRVALKKDTAGRGGSLTIQFFSDEQLQAIYDRLVDEELW